MSKGVKDIHDGRPRSPHSEGGVAMAGQGIQG